MSDKVESLKAQLIWHHPKHSRQVQLLNQIIARQSSAITELLARTEQLEKNCSFLSQDRHYLLVENSQLRKRVQDLEMTQTVDLHQFLPRKQKEDLSVLFRSTPSSEKSEMYEDRGRNGPQQLECESEMRVMVSGRKGDSREAQTPILHQPVFTYRTYHCSHTFRGLIRSFYIKLLGLPRYLSKVVEIIDLDYRYGEVEEAYLLPSYPDNGFVGDMLIEFLKGAAQVSKYSDLLNHLNRFQLYDQILQQIFTNKVRIFMAVPQELNPTTTERCFLALANAFELELNVKSCVYSFFQDSNKRLPSSQSQSGNNVYEEISLNPQPKQSAQCVNSFERVPLFEIEQANEGQFFRFQIQEEQAFEELLPFDELQFTKTQKDQSPNQFDHSNLVESVQPSQYNHFVDVPSILSSPREKGLSQDNFEDCSIDLFERARENHSNLLKKSTESMLLSGYTSQRCSQEWFGMKEYRSFKENKKGSCRPSATKGWRNPLAQLDQNLLDLLPENTEYE